MTVSALRTLQRAFVRTVTPSGTLPPGPRLAAALIGAGPRLPAKARLGIHRFAYRARLREVLANDFPGVLRLVGDAVFARLVDAYVGRHPSRHPNLNQLGRAFPTFLARRRSLRDRAAVVDVARVELAVAIAFDAEALPPLDLAGLGNLAPRLQAGARLHLQPSVQVSAHRHDVLRWLDSNGRCRPRRVRSWVCVHRVHWRVRRLALDEAQFRVLTALRNGSSLATALRRAPAGAPIATWFRQWAAAGLFAAAPGAERSSVRR